MLQTDVVRRLLRQGDGLSEGRAGQLGVLEAALKRGEVQGGISERQVKEFLVWSIHLDNFSYPLPETLVDLVRPRSRLGLPLRVDARPEVLHGARVFARARAIERAQERGLAHARVGALDGLAHLVDAKGRVGGGLAGLKELNLVGKTKKKEWLFFSKIQ